MTELVEQLARKSPYFVRCIKPNDTKSAVAFDVARVLHQVRYLGLLENVRVRKAGYAHCMTQATFLRRYKMACPNTWPVYRYGDGGGDGGGGGGGGDGGFFVFVSLCLFCHFVVALMAMLELCEQLFRSFG